MQAAAAFFALAALGGITMGIMLLRGQDRPPAWLSMLHGMLATAGFVLLAQAALTDGVPFMAQMALALFALAAAGGVYLNLGFRQRNEPIPFAILGGHATLAVLGFLMLLTAIWEANATP
ncbi:MAG: hypothetical protein K0S46_2556 [Moraxellaceae bacterium]|jgi:hypothetical protein|nr:hypothetical protein [Moraxellaceae bacterium]